MTQVKIKWRKKGGGIHYKDGKKYNKGDLLWAYPEDLTPGDKSIFERADGAAPQDDNPAEKTQPEDAGLEIVHKGFGRYNVIRKDTEEPINSRYLKKDEALALLEDGEKGEDIAKVAFGEA